ncbi:MAG: adenylate/guanylate cyclase domain-containing protein [Alphaproteobacteria bacterium]|jgi:class 3 adenylate cyclase|nr:adenylate/guanylate cyclase domain-containing protein [Alphaproteobacteria bacterium]MDP6565145.1 adenylate/guanylate cyclase domain-containing protein [Alphaproteobacteria bacterium]MDP6812334.1 adenylate/guanylate cyclase domain-containing protein [Alphaproteobacteria bacterium]
MTSERQHATETGGRTRGLRFDMRTILLFGFGGLMFLSVGVVLLLGLWSTRENTVSLTRKLADAVLDDIEDAISHRLLPAQRAVEHLGRRIETGQIDIGAPYDLQQALAGALAGLPQVGALLFFENPRRGLRVRRTEDGTIVERFNNAAAAAAHSGEARSRPRKGAYWGGVLRPPSAPHTVLNVRRQVRIDGRQVGLLSAAVTISELSTLLTRGGLAIDGEVFVLYDGNYVLAHRRLVRGFKGATTERPLPSVEQLGDPVLRTYLHPEEGRDYGGKMSREMGVQVIGLADGTAYPLISRRLHQFGDRPWEIGVYFQDAEVSAEVKRLAGASIAGLVALVVALAFAWLLARHVSRPFKELATAAKHVRHLTLNDVPPLPASRVREIDDAGRAFDAMVTSLRWFETYMPRDLVHRLMRQGEGAVSRSMRRTVTVMFTDIVGFTAASEAMGAQDMADLLNRHFAEVGACIEAEGGTIDKFIGDAVMAFWGAPEALSDHAERAVRAALAIRRAVEASNRQHRAEGATALGLRVGLHTGEVVVGNIGAPQRMNYTIVGDTVNISQRLEELGRQMADDKSKVTIIASAATVEAAGQASAAKSLGEQPVRGRRERIPVYRL